MSRVKFVATNGGYHATMGPAAIFWRDADTASGAYRVEATITQLENPKHAESYGLLVGGHDLAGAGQTYEYFLVRAYDGKFSIRRRAGRESKPSALVEWTAHEAVATADRGTGRATNRLAIETGGGRVRFFVNDVMIHEASGKALHTNGIVGYRVNHNLDVQLSPIEIRRMVRP